MDELKTVLEAHDKLTTGMASIKDVRELVTVILSAVNSLKSSLEKEMSMNKQDTIAICRGMMSDINAMEKDMNVMMVDMEKRYAKSIADVLKKATGMIDKVNADMPTMPDLTPINAKLRQIEASIPVVKDVMPEVNRKLSELSDELVKYIDSRPKTEVVSRPINIGGRAGIQILEEGAKVGTKTNEINFTNGLRVSDTNGRVGVKGQITVSATPPANPQLYDLWYDVS